MKTTLDLPADLVREIKLRAVHEDRNVKDLAAELLRAGLQVTSRPRSNPTATVEIGANGIPVVRCSGAAPAAAMNVAQLLALETAALSQEDRERL